jgi:DNA-binding MarR family transcriptional regulator
VNVSDESLPQKHVSRLIKLVKAMAAQDHATPDEVIFRLERFARGEETDPSPTSVAQFATGYLAIATKWGEMLGIPAIRNPVWAMLLELYVANHEGRKISVSGLCQASGVPWTTALRHVERLEELEMITRRADTEDKRRIWVVADPHLLQQVGELVAQIQRAARKG